CSILGVFGTFDPADALILRREALARSRLQRHRGPDCSGIFVGDGAILVHERLAIVDPEGGAQPIRSSDGNLVLAVNGEIYNHLEIREETRSSYEYTTGSDCEVINALFRNGAPD